MRNAATSGNTTNATIGERQPGLELPGLTDVQALGRSGEANRYRAMQPTTGRSVEVLVLDGEPEPRTVQQFVRDGTICARLSGQSGVIPVFDTGVTGSGRHYLVRPYYSRGSLGRHLTDNGPLPWRDAIRLMEQIAVTTAEIHSWGIVHQGLEPGNIMLTEFLGPMVGAFGASLPTGTDLILRANPSRLGPYAAPEMPELGAADPRTDVYSLGAILWALLAGRDPAAGNDRPAPFPAPGTPAPLMAVIRRAMSANIAGRPETAAGFVTDLRRATAMIENGGVPVRPASAAAGVISEPPTTMRDLESALISSPEERARAAAIVRRAITETSEMPAIQARTRPDEPGTGTADRSDEDDRTGGGTDTGSRVDVRDSGLESGAPDRAVAPAATAVADRRPDLDLTGPSRTQPLPSLKERPESRYILILVAMITIVILLMVGLAIFGMG